MKGVVESEFLYTAPQVFMALGIEGQVVKSRGETPRPASEVLYVFMLSRNAATFSATDALSL